MRRCLIVALILLVAGCNTVPVDIETAAEQTPGSGYVAVQLDAWNVGLSEEDIPPLSGLLINRKYLKGERVDIAGRNDLRILAVEPGEYRFSHFQWVDMRLGLGAGARSFDVGRDEVVYIGKYLFEFEIRKSLFGLRRMAGFRWHHTENFDEVMPEIRLRLHALNPDSDIDISARYENPLR